MARVAIIDRGFISPYWKELFALMNRESKHEYTIFHGEPPRNTGLRAAEGPFDFPNVKITNFEIPIAKGRVIYQPLVFRVIKDFDVVIVSHELKFVSSMMLALIFKVLRRPVVFWGYGFHANRGLGYQRNHIAWVTKTISRIKDTLLKVSNAYLTYTPGGKAALLERNYNPYSIWVVGQAVNMEHQTALHRQTMVRDRSGIREEYGLSPHSIVLLYIGRVVPAKNVPDVAQVTAALNDGQRTSLVEAVIVGDGPEMNRVAELAEKNTSIKLLGEIYDEQTIAELMRASDAVILPGAAGITVTHAFAHGVPILTRESEADSPEAEYVIDGVNGLRSKDDYQDFIGCVAKFVDDPELRGRLADGALKSREEYSLANMVMQFESCVNSLTNGSPE